MPAAAHHYDVLLDAARTPTEATGIAFNYLLMLQGIDAEARGAAEGGEAANGNDANGTAADNAGNAAPAPPAEGTFEAQALLLERLAREPWPLEQHNAQMSQMITLVLRDRAGALSLASLLSRGNAARQLVGARLQFEAERLFAAAAAEPDAPAIADRNLREVQNQAQAAVDSLQEIARGEDKILAARALVLLAEREANFKNPVEAARLLRAAITFEPQESALRVALVDALQMTGKTDEAIAARDALTREVPQTPENLRRAATLSLRLNQPSRAVDFAQNAQRAAQLDSAASPADAETASFVLARALWADGKSDRAEELYKKLILPQWPRADRAAALMDWAASLRATGRDATAIEGALTALGATESELRDAQELLDTL
jgi:hypothetical protein